jgi:hypothetical protein
MVRPTYPRWKIEGIGKKMVGNRASKRGFGYRVVVAAALGAIMVMGMAAPALAAPGYSVLIPIDTVVRAPAGSQTALATSPVPEEAVGQVCSVVSHAANQRSVHPGNDLIVDSGSSQVVLPNVEGIPNSTVEATGALTLGSSIEVSLLMGEDEVFSGGFDILVECELQPGRVIVVKEVTEGSDTSQAFDFTADYGEGGFSLSDGQQHDSGDLDPGTYAVSENELEGWTLDSATCDDESPVGAIEVSPGETVTCTFVNDREIEDEVLASIVVTFSSECVVDDEEEEEFGLIDVRVSVAGGADVVIRDSSGDVVDSVSDDTTLTVSAGSTYSWEATPNEGFEFPVGSATSGTLTIASCLDVDVLPFTGPETDALAIVASTLLASGLAILAFQRRRLES